MRAVVCFFLSTGWDIHRMDELCRGACMLSPFFLAMKVTSGKVPGRVVKNISSHVPYPARSQMPDGVFGVRFTMCDMTILLYIGK